VSVPEPHDDYRARAEIQRPRRRPKLNGAHRYDVVSGHPIMFGDPLPAVDLGRMPEGGGYPIGLVEFAGRIMNVDDHRRVVHLCSGSVRAPLTFDLRPETEARCIADVRHLPIRTGSVRWVMVDPPYSPEHAEELWGVGDQYPTGAALFREVQRILEPGGKVAYLHFLVPKLPAGMERIGTYGVTIGPGYRIRALTIARRMHDAEGLF
jgi:hypothetical protein